MKRQSWFDVDVKGLAKLIENKGKVAIIEELFQNAVDEHVTYVKITLTPEPNRSVCELVVEDDCPEGFKDLSHAYTLFAESYKKSDPSKRGRFNIGEKLVIALCESASISTTTGTVSFDKDGTRTELPRTRRAVGSEFRGLVRMTRSEYNDAVREFGHIIIPGGINVTFNGAVVLPRVPVHTFSTQLPTIISDAEGVLRPTARITDVRVYEVLPDEEASIYELGIPVVATSDKWHYDVQQKVPLNMERDNVTPSYLRKLRALVYNAMCEKISAEDVSETWVRDATSSPEVSEQAFKRAVELRFGKKSVSRDPNDPESANKAVAEGYTIIGGRTMSAGEWENAKKFGTVSSSSKIFPTPRPYSEGGEPVEVISPEEYTPGMKMITDYVKEIGARMIGKSVTPVIVKSMNGGIRAAFLRSGREMHFSLRALGKIWFNQGITREVNSLLIHELGHYYGDNHLSEEYYRALCDLGAILADLAIKEPDLFKKYNT